MNTIHVKYNTALTLYFYFQETQSYAGGEPVTGLSPSCGYSLDGGAFSNSGITTPEEVDATNLPGIYMVVCSAVPFNGSVCVMNMLVGAEDRSEPLLIITDLYQQHKTDVVSVSGDSTAANNLEAAFDGTGYGIQAASALTTVDVGKISGDATAANNAELFFDGTGYGVQPASGATEVKADLVKISGDTSGADNAEKFFDGTGYGIQDTTKKTVKSETTPKQDYVQPGSGSTWWRS